MVDQGYRPSRQVGLVLRYWLTPLFHQVPTFLPDKKKLCLFQNKATKKPLNDLKQICQVALYECIQNKIADPW